MNYFWVTYAVLLWIPNIKDIKYNKLKNIDISIIGDTLVCKANIDYGNGITDDINGKLILVEIDKSVKLLFKKLDNNSFILLFG